MVFVEGDDYRALRRPGDDPAQFRSVVRLPRRGIPDSVEHQYKGENFTTSTWSDSVGSADMNIIGASKGSIGSTPAADFDGVDDHGEIPLGTVDTLPEDPAFAVAFVFQDTDASTNTRWLGGVDSDSSLAVPDVEFLDGQTGDVGLTIEDPSADASVVETAPQVNDGTPHLVVINKPSDDLSKLEFYVDDMTTPVAATQTAQVPFDSSQFSLSEEVYVGSRNFRGADDLHRDTTISFLEFNTQPYSSTERQELIQRAPGF
jgi:hypothetical protein